MEILKNCLLFVGLIGLVISIRPVQLLKTDLPLGRIRSLWNLLLGLICLFILGYLAYIVLFWGTATGWVDLVVPSVFFLGAVFVLLVCWLSFRTGLDLQRIYVLEHETTIDSLTGAYNRRHFDRRLREVFSVSKRHDQPLSLIMLDIDFFKEINDEYGHPIGDIVLKRLTEVLTGGVREGDIVCRYGGEEFAIILPQTDLESARFLAERLREQVHKTEIIPENVSPSQRAVKVTISLGMATSSRSMDTEHLLLNQTDQALYLAKEAGRNRVVCAATEKNS
jgi:diguanylate cyclase (GGDEF)-like protein